MCVCHTCDVPTCVNPDHLFLGSHADNMRDMAMKHRYRMPDQRGEKHSQAKINQETADLIRRKLSDGATQRSVAREHQLNQKTVWQIAHKFIWAY